MSSRKTAAVEPSTDLLKDKRCTTRQNKCSKKPVSKSTEAIQRYLRDGTPAERTELRCHWSGGKRHNAFWQNWLGEAFLCRHKSWNNSKFEALDSHAERRRTPATTQTTTWLCSRKKRMQTIARRASGKDPARLQNHSSQSTSKTAKRTSIRGHRRIPLRGWPSNRLEVLQRVAVKPADSFVTVIKLWTIGRRAVGILSILQAWRFVKKKFSEFRTNSGCREKTERSTQTACTVAHSVSQHILESLTTFHHANTRGSRSGRLRIAYLCVLKQLSSTCHVSFLPDTDHKHKFSLTYLTYLSGNLTNTHKTFGTRSIFTLRSSTAEWRTNTNPISHSWWTQTHRGRSDRAWRSRAWKIWAWQESWDGSKLNTGKNYGRQLPKSYRRRNGWIWKSWCRDVLHPLQTRTLKMEENYEKCRLHRCICKVEEIVNHLEYQLRRGNLLQWYRRERSKCKEHTSWSERKLDVKFVSRTESIRKTRRDVFIREQGTRKLNQRVLFSNTLIRQIWEDPFLKAMKIICSIRQDLTWWSKNIKLDLSIIVSVSLSYMLMFRDWNYRTHNSDSWISTRKSSATRRIISERKVLRDTQIRCMHELGEMKRGQERRDDEIQMLTSQLQEMQEQMNSMNDSGELQEVESNCSGRLSYISNQPAMIPISRSMLSRDKRLPLDTWNTSVLQENKRFG